MFKLLVVVAVTTLAYASVIPAECLSEEGHTITKREERIDEAWMFNSQPIEVGPIIEASMAPKLQSRMGEHQDDELENLRGYYVTMDDFKGCDQPMESRIAVPEVIPAEDFSRIPVKENVWIQDRPNNEVPKEYPQDPSLFLDDDYPIETVNVEDMEVEPTQQDLKIFYNLENLPETLLNRKVPLNFVEDKRAAPPKENLLFDSSVRENSEVVAEVKHMQAELAELPEVTQDEGTPEQEQEQGGDGPKPDDESGSTIKPTVESQNESEDETEQINNMMKKIKQVKHLYAVGENLKDLIGKLEVDNSNNLEKGTNETNNGTEGILS